MSTSWADRAESCRPGGFASRRWSGPPGHPGGGGGAIGPPPIPQGTGPFNIAGGTAWGPMNANGGGKGKAPLAPMFPKERKPNPPIPPPPPPRGVRVDGPPRRGGPWDGPPG